jgi:hypothetical protein
VAGCGGRRAGGDQSEPVFVVWDFDDVWKIFTDFFNPEVIFARVYGDVYEDRYNTVYRDLSPNGYNGYSAYNVLEQMVEAFPDE